MLIVRVARSRLGNPRSIAPFDRGSQQALDGPDGTVLPSERASVRATGWPTGRLLYSQGSGDGFAQAEFTPCILTRSAPVPKATVNYIAMETASLFSESNLRPANERNVSDNTSRTVSTDGRTDGLRWRAKAPMGEASSCETKSARKGH